MAGGALDRAMVLANEHPERLLCIVGPTATGKTELAVEMAARLDGEIISADSVQIYRYFDIGSGKPTADEIARAPHHLVGQREPTDTIDAVSFAALAESAISDIRARGKRPIVCGGTFFWVRSLVMGLVEAPAADQDARARHRALVASGGRSALYEALRTVDPESATRLHPNDVVRVSRALEVFELSGRKMSDWQADHGFRAKKHDATMLALRMDPDVLTPRIGARVDRWLAGGWLDEVRALVERGFGETRAMQSVGYAEVHAFVSGTLARDALRDSIVRATRVFARRQRTWLNHAPVMWL